MRTKRIDKSIVHLGKRLDAWWDEFATLLDSDDRAEQGKALLRGFDTVRELDHLKATGLAAIAALANQQHAQTPRERAAALIRGFELSANFADVLHDEFGDTDAEVKVWRLMDTLVQQLNAISPGRAALAALLDHRDAGVRASAGAYLIDLMTDRVAAVLRDVREKEHANSAHFNAYWTLVFWERERKSRFNYLDS